MKIKSLVTVLFFIFLSSCASLQKPRVPGLKQCELEPIPTSSVLTAIKFELGEAFAEIDSLKGGGKNVSSADVFQFKIGNASLSGFTQTVKTDAGNVNAVIPLTVYTGSSLFPSVAGGNSTTSDQRTTLQFSIDPSAHQILSSEQIENIEVQGFIRDAIVSTYKEVIKVPQGYDPEFTNTGLLIETNFSIVRSVTGGISSTLLVPANDLDQLLPGLSIEAKRSRTYSLSLNFPMLTGDAADPRKLIYGTASENGVVLVEEPFTQKKYNAYSKKLSNSLNKTISRKNAPQEGPPEAAPRVETPKPVLLLPDSPPASY